MGLGTESCVNGQAPWVRGSLLGGISFCTGAEVKQLRDKSGKVLRSLKEE